MKSLTKIKNSQSLKNIKLNLQSVSSIEINQIGSIGVNLFVRMLELFPLPMNFFPDLKSTKNIVNI